MKIEKTAFEESLAGNMPPDSFTTPLKSLWFDAKGNWKKAHDLVDHAPDVDSKWVHAYLHRKEGDEWNAGYWYRQARKPFCETTLENEFVNLLDYLCSKD